ncbi:MAG: RNA polymerase sigma factor [Desulfuromonas sp.]|nr:MAG: RNA polymerase sigma factor [Desulfuromonas sp.]
MNRSLEDHLLQRAREGDESSFEQLVTSHAPRLLALARRLVGTPDQAEDIVQEAFLRLHRNLATFRGESSIGTWLYRTVTHVAIDHLRREKIRQRLFFFRSNNDSPDPLDLSYDSRPDPDQMLVAHELSTVMNRALKNLSARQRTIFVLRHHEGLAIKEIAATLKLEEGTVKAHLHRAMTALRQTLREYRENLG